MARIRNIKPEFFDDEGLGTVSIPARLCFIGLWTQADKAGRLEDRPARLKVRLFPFDRTVNIVSLIDELVREGCVFRYAVGDRRYLAIRKFSEHQYLSKREPESTLPAPSTGETKTDPDATEPDQDDTGTGQVPDKPETGTVPVLDQSQTGTVDIGHRTRDIGQGTPARATPVATGPHRNHAFCGTPCVPAFLHVEFRNGLNRADEDDADQELRRGYLAHVASWPEGQPVGDAIQFWRAWYRATYPGPKGVVTRSAGPTYGSQDWYHECQHNPKCDTGPMHRQQLGLEESRRRRA